MKIWQKKDTRPIAGKSLSTETFTVGNDYILDLKLIPWDVKASKVHARSLQKAGILTHIESSQISSELDEIVKALEQGHFQIRPDQEDGHTAIEEWLTKRLGETGKKIHAGRSRNDQVLTAMRLYEQSQLEKVSAATEKSARSLLEFAKCHQGVPLPGFTHTRKAMLSGVSQWACGYAEMLIMQLGMLKSLKSLVSRSPLGTAAGFGSTINLDREAQAEETGFDTVMVSATTAQLSRGWAEWQIVNGLAGVTVIMARLASDVIRYSSETHGFFDLDSAVCTGSSIMPQKQNPDVAEIIRGKNAVMLGQASILQNLIQNLESGYHRDLQLTKEPVMTAFETVLDVLDASNLLLASIKVNAVNVNNACTPELFAAEAANVLVTEKGMSFREAYREVASNPVYCNELSVEILMNRYKQLGSPGNPGIERLHALLG